jgi:hypothetical protein
MHDPNAREDSDESDIEDANEGSEDDMVQSSEEEDLVDDLNGQDMKEGGLPVAWSDDECSSDIDASFDTTPAADAMTSEITNMCVFVLFIIFL